MATATTENVVKIILELNEKESKALRDYLHYLPHNLPPYIETPLIIIWDALGKAGVETSKNSPLATKIWG